VSLYFNSCQYYHSISYAYS